ncbi:MAG: ligase-associated DNA damage response endonuclease PdeM [Pirellulaceae bacterium]|nr:ligase-associated DNA damage response endonuclease PdeM [Pirellulaceae bacterium]
MHGLQHQVSVHRAGTELILLPCKMVWWPDGRILFAADTHFGKASSFRQAGIPVPAGTTATMLDTLSTQIKLFEPRELVILGDFVHSSRSAQDDFESLLLAWRASHQHLPVTLIKGNHDRRTADFYGNLRIALRKERQVACGPFTLCHSPQDINPQAFNLCGHLHPGYAVPQLGLRCAPCFWLATDTLVLPAFGVFTGLARVTLESSQSAILIHQQMLLQVDG